MVVGHATTFTPEEQATLVVRLTTNGHPVDVVVAAAGTGKTFALDAARHAWQQSDHRVIGTALAARAAAELEAWQGSRPRRSRVSSPISTTRTTAASRPARS